jgi:hypothetical protein
MRLGAILAPLFFPFSALSNFLSLVLLPDLLTRSAKLTFGL